MWKILYAVLGADPAHVHFHYLPLPLTFRARGGFGTHWMHAGSFDLKDPRARSVPGGSLSSANITREELDEVWLALHDPHTPYCSHRSYGSIVTDKVRRWICGSLGDPHATPDLHVAAWQKVISDLQQ